MKQGTKLLLPVEFGLDLDTVQKILFKFMQDGYLVKTFTYTSGNTSTSTAYREGTTDVVNLVWTKADTYAFVAKRPILMDTLVTLKNSAYNPETEIVEMTMSPTLFKASEVGT